MSMYAFWKRLDTPGHDAALLRQGEDGWWLTGTAVFRHAAGPACIDYLVEVDAGWRTRQGKVRGFVADRRFEHVVRRAPEGWYFDSELVGGLTHLWDLDYGFTPATNLLQLRRVSLSPGQAADVPVAWFDVDSPALTELAQRYERRGEAAYWYQAPGVPYEALLELSPNGFAKSYPGLWQMEP